MSHLASSRCPAGVRFGAQGLVAASTTGRAVSLTACRVPGRSACPGAPLATGPRRVQNPGAAATISWPSWGKDRCLDQLE